MGLTGFFVPQRLVLFPNSRHGVGKNFIPDSAFKRNLLICRETGGVAVISGVCLESPLSHCPAGWKNNSMLIFALTFQEQDNLL